MTTFDQFCKRSMRNRVVYEGVDMDMQSKEAHGGCVFGSSACVCGNVGQSEGCSKRTECAGRADVLCDYAWLEVVR